jgi:hypothetical protein
MWRLGPKNKGSHKLGAWLFRAGGWVGAGLGALMAARLGPCAETAAPSRPQPARATASTESPPASHDQSTPRTTVIVVVGAPGEEPFGQSFRAWAQRWQQACDQAQAQFEAIGLEPGLGTNDRARLEARLAQEPGDGPEPLWLVLLGHGTFDGTEAKFNLRGPDLSATDLAQWLDRFRRPVVVINASACSAPFLVKLSRPGRVIITATRSGTEQNFARFGQFISTAIMDPQADLDKDGQVSLLEAYLTAAAGVAEFYESEGRIATEHPLLDDNGDGLGTPPTFFRGVRAIKKPREDAAPDGLRAHQMHLIPSPEERRLPAAVRAQRDELELALNRLREAKTRMTEPEYYAALETLLLRLAELYETHSAPSAGSQP